jgi:hypothetical protein
MNAKRVLMRTAIKVWAIRASVIVSSLIMIGFGLGASVVIFSECVKIVLGLGYTKLKTGAILSGIGIALMWLVTLLGDSANAFLISGFKKASQVEETE